MKQERILKSPEIFRGKLAKKNMIREEQLGLLRTRNPIVRSILRS